MSIAVQSWEIIFNWKLNQAISKNPLARRPRKKHPVTTKTVIFTSIYQLFNKNVNYIGVL
jgi:hypothetical protein